DSSIPKRGVHLYQSINSECQQARDAQSSSNAAHRMPPASTRRMASCFPSADSLSTSPSLSDPSGATSARPGLSRSLIDEQYLPRVTEFPFRDRPGNAGV